MKYSYPKIVTFVGENGRGRESKKLIKGPKSTKRAKKPRGPKKSPKEATTPEEHTHPEPKEPKQESDTLIVNPPSGDQIGQ